MGKYFTVYMAFVFEFLNAENKITIIKKKKERERERKEKGGTHTHTQSSTASKCHHKCTLLHTG
jgi:hypothetical protein